MSRRTHGKNCQRKNKKRGRLLRTLARETYHGSSRHVSRWEMRTNINTRRDALARHNRLIELEKQYKK